MGMGLVKCVSRNRHRKTESDKSLHYYKFLVEIDIKQLIEQIMKGGGPSDRRSGIGEPHNEYTEPLDAAIPKDICQGLHLNSCRLQRPTEELDILNVGDTLLVEEHTPTIVKILTHSGDLCGYIMGDKVSKLAECLAKGNIYQAVIVHKDRRICDVDIEKA